jgi:uncharacterized protein
MNENICVHQRPIFRGDELEETVKRDWLRAVRKAMRKMTQAEAMRRYGKPDPAFNYRWEHVTAVVRVADRLARITGADTEIVAAAAWLHDIAKHKGANHPAAGAKFARKFLQRTNFPEAKIEAVAQAIADHMGLWRDEALTNLESQVLWDADKLTKIGLTAAFHWAGMMLSNGKTVTTKELIKNGRKADWQEKTVSSMHTEPAQHAAQRRLDAFNRLWDELEAELQGLDLKGENDGQLTIDI